MTGMRAAVGAIIAAAAIIIGLAIYEEATEPDTGRVTAKDHRAAWTQVGCSGKPLICHTTYHPECWEVTYVNQGDTGDACVTEDEYRHLDVGSWYGSDER